MGVNIEKLRYIKYLKKNKEKMIVKYKKIRKILLIKKCLAKKTKKFAKNKGTLTF